MLTMAVDDGDEVSLWEKKLRKSYQVDWGLDLE